MQAADGTDVADTCTLQTMDEARVVTQLDESMQQL